MRGPTTSDTLRSTLQQPRIRERAADVRSFFVKLSYAWRP